MPSWTAKDKVITSVPLCRKALVTSSDTTSWTSPVKSEGTAHFRIKASAIRLAWPAHVGDGDMATWNSAGDRAPCSPVERCMRVLRSFE
ncbi:hypothetical protein SGPA1_12117 [Streptomyces misionensis JCM 4497]